MFYYSLASLIPLAILMVIVVISARAICLAVVPPRRCVKEASCEKCRYPVAGLTMLTCPECGSNLLQSGIITRPMEMRRRGSYVGAISGLVTLLLCCMWIGWMIAYQTIGFTGPNSLPPTTQITLAAPSSGSYTQLIITQNGDASNPAASRSATLEIVVSGEAHTMNIDVSGGLYFWVTHPGGRTGSSGRFDGNTLTNWFKGAGVDVSNARVAREIGELESLVSAWPGPWVAPTGVDLPSFVITSTTALNSLGVIKPSLHRLYFLVFWSIPAVGLSMFVLFTVLIVRRRRRLLQDAEAASHAANLAT